MSSALMTPRYPYSSGFRVEGSGFRFQAPGGVGWGGVEVHGCGAWGFGMQLHNIHHTPCTPKSRALSGWMHRAAVRGAAGGIGSSYTRRT